MAATFVIQEGNGSGPTWTDLTGITGRYCTEDSYNPGTSNPCKVPSTGYYYSFWKSHRGKITGTYSSVRNIYWYCDGGVAAGWGLGTGGQLQIGILASPTTGNGTSVYQKADGTVGTTGIAIDDGSLGHASYNSGGNGVANADTYNSGNPLLIDTTQYTYEVGVTKYTKIWVTQLKIAPTATQGDKSARTFVVMYDEY